jgi:hypothetical protein
MKRGVARTIAVLALAVALAMVGLILGVASAQKNAHQPNGSMHHNHPSQHPKQPVKVQQPVQVEVVNGSGGSGTVGMPTGGDEADCPDGGGIPVDTAAAQMAKEPEQEAIEFTVQESNPVLNFGTSRDMQEDYVVLKASKKIPKEVTPANFEIDTVQPMRRIGEASLLSSHLPPPTFTEPHFFNHRTEISFSLCVESGGKDAGTYTGQFQFVSPGTIETATLTQTAQLKTEESSFIFWFVLVLLLSAALLIVNLMVLPGRPKGGREWVARSMVILLSLAAAGSAMLVAWSQSATWGENIWVAVGALVATAFAAAGLGGTLSAAALQINPTKDPKGKAKDPPPEPPIN